MAAGHRLPPIVRRREPSPALRWAHRVEAVVAHEQALFAEGVDVYGLMRQAGTAVFEELRERWPAARRIAVLVGPGQNGGDGLVVARLAREAGLSVDLLGWKRPEFTRAAARAWQALRECDADIDVNVGSDGIRAALARAEVLIDALFGIGLSRPIEGRAGEFMRRLGEALADMPAATRPAVLAVDAPSGLDCDTGAVDPLTLAADVTVTFLGIKAGQVTGAGVARCGRRVLAELGYPMTEPTPGSLRLLHGDRSLAPRALDGHKGCFGTVLVVGGNRGMPGAARLAAEAALRSGTGKVIVATHPAHAATLNVGRPELIVHAVEQGGDLAPLLDQATAVVFGPGLGRDAWAASMRDGLRADRRPTVADADALRLLRPDSMTERPLVITSHPGEAAELLDRPVAEINADRPANARRLAERYGAAAVLKGAGSVIASDEGLAVCLRGSPALATAGSGDVLSGVIGGLLGLDFPAVEAAEAGVSLHALAGEIEAHSRGTWGAAARDFLDPLRALLNGRLQAERPAIDSHRPGRSENRS
jgi:NAD(P)H-hydrate epimerase